MELKDKLPNKAHIKIKELKDKYPNEIAIITQNVDDMFEKAGIKDVIHLHGFITSIYCEECDFKENIGYIKQLDSYSKCPKCNNDLLRPDIVFFNESAPKYFFLKREMRDCEFLVIIGTSGNVINPDNLIHPELKYTILNNLEVSDAINDKKYKKVLYKKATDAIDEIVDDINKFLTD